jgi:hypothetical protein
MLFSATLNFALAHADDISKASLSLEGSQRYQLTITVDILHLLKRYQNIVGDDAKVIASLKAMSFSQQKQLLNNLHRDLTQQSSIRFTKSKSSVSKNSGNKNNSNNIAEHSTDTTFEKNLIPPIEQNINTLRGLSLSQLKKTLSFGAELANRHTELHTTGKIPQGIDSVSVRFSPLLSHIQLSVIRPQQDLVPSNEYSERFQIIAVQDEANSTVASAIEVTKDYIVQGFVHILPLGLDHILFVLALFLFAKSFSSLLWQVSAFTLAHTITLALSIYGIVQLPSSIVEPLIALSILYVALENFYRAKSTTIARTRLPVIFAFGLLHGLGFASVLLDVGLPESQYALSLISFNIGVELGQLSVIVIAFLCLAPVMKKHWYQSTVVRALNITIAIIATYWLIERVL